MAVTLDAPALARALGLQDGTGTTTLDPAAVRLFNVAKGLVERYAPSAPDDVLDEALLRTADYLHADSPSLRVLRSIKLGDALALEPRAPGSAVRLSGAATLMSPWRVRRAVRAEAGGP